MATENLIRIGPSGDIQEISAFGRVFLEREEEGLTREERASSGKLRRDIISRKKNFILSYETADQDVVDRARELYAENDELTIEITQADLSIETYQVLLLPYSKQRLLAVWGGLWEGVALEFLEV